MLGEERTDNHAQHMIVKVIILMLLLLLYPFMRFKISSGILSTIQAYMD